MTESPVTPEAKLAAAKDDLVDAAHEVLHEKKEDISARVMEGIDKAKAGVAKAADAVSDAMKKDI